MSIIAGLSYDDAVVRRDIGIIFHHFHSRYRVYPQDVTTTVTLAAGAPANTFGLWTQVIPLNTVPFDMMIVGIVIEAADAATTYLVQLGYNIINADPGVNMELGERRLRLPTPIPQATELLDIHAQHSPANSKIWGRLKSASGNLDELEISVVVTRHVMVSAPVDLWPAFPW